MNPRLWGSRAFEAWSAKTKAKVEAMPAPIARAVTESPEELEATYDEVKALVRLMKTELTASLGVILTFNDNDGD
mgnify:CR=1 FL=1